MNHNNEKRDVQVSGWGRAKGRKVKRLILKGYMAIRITSKKGGEQ
jgi:hypothetical protein